MDPSLSSLDTVKKFALPGFVVSKQAGWIFFMICTNAIILITDFQSPMFESKVGNLFVNDLILFNDYILGETMG